MPDLPPHSCIEALRTPKNDPAWRTVMVNGRAVARLLASSAEALGLAPGLEWTPERAARAEHQGALDRCRAHALGLLGPRALSRCELEARLAGRGHAADIAKATLARLESERLVDDGALALAIVEASDARRPAGESLLRARLLKRGIDGALVDSILRDRAGDPLEDAMRALESTARPADAELPPLARARRYLSRLARRGFDEDTAREAVARLVPEARGHDA